MKNIEKGVLIVIIFIMTVILVVFGSIIVFFSLQLIGGDKTIIAGIIGAIGGVIGGLFTLISVSWTMKKQKTDKFIEGFPKKLHNLHEISKILFEELSTSFSKHPDLSQDSDILENTRKALILASEVDGEAYNYVVQYEKIVRHYLMKRLEPKYSWWERINDSYRLTHDSEKNRGDLLNIVRNDIKESIEAIDYYREKISGTFNRLTAID